MRPACCAGIQVINIATSTITTRIGRTVVGILKFDGHWLKDLVTALQSGEGEDVAVASEVAFNRYRERVDDGYVGYASQLETRMDLTASFSARYLRTPRRVRPASCACY